MKKLISLLLCVAVLTALTGCVSNLDGTAAPTDPAVTQPIDRKDPIVQPTGNQPTVTQPADAGYRMPTVDPDYWELLCENCDYTMHFSGMHENFLMFPLISALDLEGKFVTVTTDYGVTAELEIFGAGTLNDFPFYTFLMYQEFDWSTLDADPYTRAQSEAPWLSAYQSVKSALPELFFYRVHLPFDMLGIHTNAAQPQQIRTLTVTLEGKTKTYALGNVRFLSSGLEENTSSLGGLTNVNGLLISEYSVDASENGTMKIPNWELKAKADLVLQGIHVADHPDVELLSCDLSITTPTGDSFKMRWDGKTPIEVDEGSKLRLDLVLADPFLAKALQANLLRYILLDYTNDGEAFSQVMYISCRVWTSPHDIYVMKLDGVDMWPYYAEYRYYGQQ